MKPKCEGKEETKPWNATIVNLRPGQEEGKSTGFVAYQ
jgi:hypothetical protein